MTETTAARSAVVAFIRVAEDEHRKEAATLRPHCSTSRIAFAEWSRAVHKASMARVLAAYIERGDHMVVGQGGSDAAT